MILINIDFNEAFDTVSYSILVCKLRRCEQDKWAARNAAGLAGMKDNDQQLDAWLTEDDEHTSLVLCMSTLGATFIAPITDLDGDTQSILSSFTDYGQ